MRGPAGRHHLRRRGLRERRALRFGERVHGGRHHRLGLRRDFRFGPVSAPASSVASASASPSASASAAVPRGAVAAGYGPSDHTQAAAVLGALALAAGGGAVVVRRRTRTGRH
ncbi:hypothetical protein [Kitasatospora fiedleri]|uniref:hypothetical protein n=1 Tax=Kitasatospora fiedleri TaxID=2991545 RepID=UPI002499D3EA|nr:hypothetical protein [Kitasatospora fiedleri]